MKIENQLKSTKLIKLAILFFQNIKKIRNHINKRMEGTYSPSLFALVVTFFLAILTIIMLFIPNYLGVADDGSVTKIMNASSIYYLQEDPEDIYNNYFVKTYSNIMLNPQQLSSSVSSHILIVKAAVFFDDLITHDRLFDIRFLALIYTMLYIPAIYLIIKLACNRVKTFSEGAVIGIMGGIIFSDVAYITYFNSFYPEAVWLISMLYCIGLAMSFQGKRTGFTDIGYLLCFLFASTFLISSKRQCAIIGIILALYCIKLLFIRRHLYWRIVCVLAVVYLCSVSIISLVNLDKDFDDTSKFHAMTRGVLFSSNNPASTLAEFGIQSSYEMLTDASSYDYLPLVKANDLSIQKGFLDQYSIPDIAGYYTRHPGKLLKMVDISIKSCFDIRRSYCGNYEKSVGMPEKAKSIFWSTWSTFKSTSAPKTIGFLIILVIAIFMLFGKKYSLRPVEDRRSTVLLDVLLVVLLIILSQSIITIINSGDAEMIQHCFLISLGMDIITYFVFSEIIHRLNIL